MTICTYSPFSKSYRATEKSSLPATRYLPSWEMSTEFIYFCWNLKIRWLIHENLQNLWKLRQVWTLKGINRLIQFHFFVNLQHFAWFLKLKTTLNIFKIEKLNLENMFTFLIIILSLNNLGIFKNLIVFIIIVRKIGNRSIEYILMSLLNLLMLVIVVSYLYLLLTLIIEVLKSGINLILKLILLEMILILVLIEQIRLDILRNLVILLIILQTYSTLYILVIAITLVHTRHLFK